jgi:hypothetical protein
MSREFFQSIAGPDNAGPADRMFCMGLIDGVITRRRQLNVAPVNMMAF